VKGGGLCRDCHREIETDVQRKLDREVIAEWAYDLLNDPAGFVILDSETTGLSNALACQVAVVDQAGTTLVDTLVKPGVSIPAEATRIHGITDAMVADAPDWTEVELLLRAALEGRTVLIYNASYDIEVLANMIVQAGVWPGVGVMEYLGADGQAQCAMTAYAQFVGEWNSRYGNYRWHRLENVTWGADIEAPAHSALGDCLRTLHVLREMARWHEERAAEATEA
jgi:DNA polymerase-3 subunit epsilon